MSDPCCHALAPPMPCHCRRHAPFPPSSPSSLSQSIDPARHPGQRLDNSRLSHTARDPLRNERVGKLWSARSCCHDIREWKFGEPLHLKSAPRVRTMTVEENHIINIDGSSSNKPSAKHHPSGGSNVALHQTNTDIDEHTQHLLMADPEDPPHPGAQAGLPCMTGDQYVHDPVLHGSDTDSVVSGRSKTTSQLEEEAKMPWYRGVTCKDIRAITPTLLILFGGLLIMIFVIPYAFSSVIKQLEAEHIIEAARKREYEAKMAARLNLTLTTTTVEPTISEGDDLFENDGET